MKIASKVKNKHKQYPVLLKTEQSLQYSTLTIWHKNISQHLLIFGTNCQKSSITCIPIGLTHKKL